MSWKASIDRNTAIGLNIKSMNVGIKMIILSIYPIYMNDVSTTVELGYTSAFGTAMLTYKDCNDCPDAVVIEEVSVNTTWNWAFWIDIPGFRRSLIVPSGRTWAVKSTPLFIKDDVPWRSLESCNFTWINWVGSPVTTTAWLNLTIKTGW